MNYADRGAQLEDDTFEHILQETAHHDTVMAFYYMDENNKVQFFEKNVYFCLPLCASLLLVSFLMVYCQLVITCELLYCQLGPTEPQYVCDSCCANL